MVYNHERTQDITCGSSYIEFHFFCLIAVVFMYNVETQINHTSPTNLLYSFIYISAFRKVFNGVLRLRQILNIQDHINHMLKRL